MHGTRASSSPFRLFLGSFQRWRVGESIPVPVPVPTRVPDPCGFDNPRQSLMSDGFMYLYSSYGPVINCPNECAFLEFCKPFCISRRDSDVEERDASDFVVPFKLVSKMYYQMKIKKGHTNGLRHSSWGPSLAPIVSFPALALARTRL